MNTKRIGFALLFMGMVSAQSFAQNTSLEIDMGLREEIYHTQINKGMITAIPNARPVATVNLRYLFAEKWSAKFGVGSQLHAQRSTVQSGFDMGAILNRQILPMASVGVERNLFQTSRLDFNVGVSQQFLFILNSTNVLASNVFPEGGSLNNTTYKLEEVRGYRAVNPISQLHAQLHVKLINPKNYLLIGYGYNYGWQNLLTRTIRYAVNSQAGEGSITTRGTGGQIKVGMAFGL